MEGIAHGPDGGEKVARAARHHRILAELPELEAIELRFGPQFEGVGLFRNAGDGALRMLNVHAPNVGFAQRLRDA